MSWSRTNFACYSVEFSPFRGDLYAVGSAQYYGIVGNGKQSIFRRDGSSVSQNNLQPVIEWVTQDGVYDCTWSEQNDNIICSGCGDGTIKLFDINRPQGPIANVKEHSAEVYGVDWNSNARNLICSASWDGSTLVIDANRMGGATGGGGGCVLKRYQCHQKVAYSSIWSPHRANVFASIGGDGRLNLYDINSQTAPTKPVSSIQAHQYEILSVDWLKYQDTQLVTGGVDKQIRVWDLRNLRQPMKVLFGHQLAVRRLKSHPHNGNLIGSCSYDMSCKIWDLSMGQMVQSFDHHSEFVLGLDFSLFEPNVIASASWDRTICCWNHEVSRPPPVPPGFKQGRTGNPGMAAGNPGMIQPGAINAGMGQSGLEAEAIKKGVGKA